VSLSLRRCNSLRVVVLHLIQGQLSRQNLLYAHTLNVPVVCFRSLYVARDLKVLGGNSHPLPDDVPSQAVHSP
jgi:hypothetical protein